MRYGIIPMFGYSISYIYSYMHYLDLVGSSREFKRMSMMVERKG